MVAVFFGAFVADLSTYCVTSVQLALAFPDPGSGFLGALGKFGSHLRRHPDPAGGERGTADRARDAAAGAVQQGRTDPAGRARSAQEAARTADRDRGGGADEQEHEDQPLLLLLVAALAVLPVGASVSATTRRSRSRAPTRRRRRRSPSSKPDYEPWFSPLYEPPSGEIESALFALQAALGAGVLAYYFGLRKGRRQGAQRALGGGADERAGAPDAGREVHRSRAGLSPACCRSTWRRTAVAGAAAIPWTRPCSGSASPCSRSRCRPGRARPWSLADRPGGAARAGGRAAPSAVARLPGAARLLRHRRAHAARPGGRPGGFVSLADDGPLRAGRVCCCAPRRPPSACCCSPSPRPMSDLLPRLVRAGVPAPVVDVALVTYRMSFLLLDSMRRIRQAQAARLGHTSRAASGVRWPGSAPPRSCGPSTGRPGSRRGSPGAATTARCASWCPRPGSPGPSWRPSARFSRRLAALTLVLERPLP